MVLALRFDIKLFTKTMKEHVPLRNMQVYIPSLQKFRKIYCGEKRCNDKMMWFSNKIKFNKSILHITKKFAKAGITVYEHLLSPDKQYLSYADLILKFGLPKMTKIFSLYIKLVVELSKQWDRVEIRIRVPNSLELRVAIVWVCNKNEQTVFDKLSYDKALKRQSFKRHSS